MNRPAIALTDSTTVRPLLLRTAISVSALLDRNSTPWIEPEKSIGPFHIAIKGEMCWRCKGPAADAFDEVAVSIQELLNSHQEYLEDGEEIMRIISFNMWMIGRSAKLARPTIVVTSKSKRCRRKAMELIKKYELLSKWPGVELRTMERLPAVLTMEVSRVMEPRRKGVDYKPAVTGRSLTSPPTLNPTPLATATSTRSGNRASMGIVFSAGDTAPSDAESWAFPTEGGTEMYTVESPTNACGTPIIVGSSRRVTLGGVLLVGTTYYGFTVAHARSELEEIEEPDEGGEELAFDDYSDGDNCSSDANSDGSVSPKSDHGEELDEPRSLGTNGNSEIDDADQKPNNESQVSIPVPTPGSPRRTPHALPEGQVGTATLPDKYEQSDLDYEIFRVTPREYCTWNEIYPPSTGTGIRGRIVVNGPAKRVPAESKVLVATGTTGPVMGTIQGSPHHIKMGSGRSFQEMWLVQMDRRTMRGDSGSWVIDPIDGELYGHLVAGDPLTGCAYMIPAFKVFEDLEKKFGQVTLPTRNNMAEFLTDASPALTQSPSVRTSCRDSARLSARANSVGQPYMLDLVGDIVEPVQNVNVTIYECPFRFLLCRESFYDPKTWRSHADTHFEGYPPPRHTICCFCDMTFNDESPNVSWGLRMDHVAAHHMRGDRLRQCRPDHSLMRYMYEHVLMLQRGYQAHASSGSPGEMTVYDDQQAVQSIPGVKRQSEYVDRVERPERRGPRRR